VQAFWGGEGRQESAGLAEQDEWGSAAHIVPCVKMGWASREKEENLLWKKKIIVFVEKELGRRRVAS